MLAYYRAPGVGGLPILASVSLSVKRSLSSFGDLGLNPDLCPHGLCVLG